MSWSKTVGPGTGPALVEEIGAIDITEGGNSSPEQAEQIALGKKLVTQGIESGAIGSFEDGTEFSVSFSGHANPRHNPHTKGAGSADGINIRISQTSAPELPEPAAEETPIEDEVKPPVGMGDGE